jgi:ribosomal protein S18 acetylase RimI-like enzyme
MTDKQDQSVVIREMRIEDYEALIKLWKDASLPFRPEGRDSKEEIKRQLGLQTSVFLMAEMEGVLVGTVLGTHDGRKGWINRLAVAPEHRERGIARMLVEETERRLHELGIGMIAVMIEDWNQKSVKVFKKLGYEPFEGITYLRKRKEPGI